MSYHLTSVSHLHILKLKSLLTTFLICLYFKSGLSQNLQLIQRASLKCTALSNTVHSKQNQNQIEQR